MKILWIALWLAVALAPRLVRADPAANAYDPRATFAPLNLYPPPSRVRSASGAPGPDYWQNRADCRSPHAWSRRPRPSPARRRSPTPTTAPTRSMSCGCSWIRTSIRRFHARRRRQQLLQLPLHRRLRAGGGGGRGRRQAHAGPTPGQRHAPAGAPARAARDRRRPARLHIKDHYTVPGLFGGRTAARARVRARRRSTTSPSEYLPDGGL